MSKREYNRKFRAYIRESKFKELIIDKYDSKRICDIVRYIDKTENIELKKYILNETKFLDEYDFSYTISITQRIFHIYSSNATVPKCQECSREVRFDPHSISYLFTCSKKCATGSVGHKKSKDTCLKKYGVENPFQSEVIKEKSKKTNLKKTGFEYQSQCSEAKQKAEQTMIKNGKKIPDSNLSLWKIYKREVRIVTRHYIKQLFSNWDGFDYYDGEYIKHNKDLKLARRLLPTIDHKISVFYGFNNNISIDIIGNIKNLCITKMYINSGKREKSEEQFVKTNNIKKK